MRKTADQIKDPWLMGYNDNQKVQYRTKKRYNTELNEEEKQ